MQLRRTSLRGVGRADIQAQLAELQLQQAGLDLLQHGKTGTARRRPTREQALGV